jgi:hypothetical protein
VVGLTGITIEGLDTPVNLNLSSTPSTAYSHDLGTVANNVAKLFITAVSGVTNIPPEAGITQTLTITRTAPAAQSGEEVGGAAVSGQATTIDLATLAADASGELPVNTITVVRSLSKGGVTVTRTYTLTVKRSRLVSGTEFFVSSTPGPGGGNGSAASPYGTVEKALDLIRDSGLESIDDSYVTIIIAGTVTADTGTSNGMVEISGSGYPKKIILRGKSGRSQASLTPEEPDASSISRTTTR